MKRLSDKELKLIIGGVAFSYSLINSFTKIITVILGIGRNFGNSMRRLEEGKICGLE